MGIFWGRQCAFVFPIYVREYRKYTIDRWIVVYTVCASAVISPLKHWLDSYVKTRLKMCHTSKHFICNTFCCWLILFSSLYIELAMVCCTNPDDVHCFGTIFPNLNFVFASICTTRPVHIQSDQYRSCSTVKQRRAVGAAPFIPMQSNQKQRCGSEFAKTRSCSTGSFASSTSSSSSSSSRSTAGPAHV